MLVSVGLVTVGDVDVGVLVDVTEVLDVSVFDGGVAVAEVDVADTVGEVLVSDGLVGLVVGLVVGDAVVVGLVVGAVELASVVLDVVVGLVEVSPLPVDPGLLALAEVPVAGGLGSVDWLVDGELVDSDSGTGGTLTELVEATEDVVESTGGTIGGFDVMKVGPTVTVDVATAVAVLMAMTAVPSSERSCSRSADNACWSPPMFTPPRTALARPKALIACTGSPCSNAARACSIAVRTTMLAVIESARSAQTTRVTGQRASPGVADRAPTTADPRSNATMDAATNTIERRLRRRAADFATRAAASATGIGSGSDCRRSCALQTVSKDFN